jgi:hypothetical protein
MAEKQYTYDFDEIEDDTIRSILKALHKHGLWDGHQPTPLAFDNLYKYIRGRQ